MNREGIIRFHVPDRYTLEVAEDEHIELDFRPELPINVRVMLDLETYEYVVLPEQPMSRHETNKHIAVYYLRKIDSDKERAEATEIVNSFAEDLYNFYTQFGRDWIDLKVSGHLLDMEMCPYGPYAYCTKEMKAAHRSLEDAPFDPNYWHIIGYARTGVCGQATLGGSAGVTYSRHCTSKTTIHELGHNFGLMHAGKLKVDGTVDEYGDKTSVLGGSGAGGFMPINAHYIGWYREGEVCDINDTKQVLIVPYEMDYPSRQPNEHAIVRVHKDKEPFFLSLRKCDGVKNGAHYKLKNKLFIHRKDGSGSVLHKTLDVGESFFYENIIIDYIENTDETAVVDVVYNDVEVSDTVDVIQGFPLAPSFGTIGVEHQGAWHDLDRIGQGIDVYHKDGRTTLAWYTYNTRNDARRFYTATSTGKLFNIYTTHGGTFEDPSKHESRKVGTGQLYFISGNKGVFNYNIENVGRNTLRLSPVVLNPNSLDGFFWRPERDGEGVSIHFLPGGRFVCYWYTYGEPMDLGWGTPETPEHSTMQRWYTATGKLGEEVSLNEVVGLRFMEFARKLPIREAGRIKLELVGSNWLNLYSTLGDIKMRRLV